MLQQRLLCKQAGCDQAKHMEEHSLEVNVCAEYNKSLCSTLDRTVYCKKSSAIQIFDSLTLYECMRPELVLSEMRGNSTEIMRLPGGEGGICPEE